MSNIISHSIFYERCKGIFEDRQRESLIPSDALIPSLRWFEFQFWPCNEYVTTAFKYTGRFPMIFTVQKRTLRKQHGHAHYCAQQSILLKAWSFKFADLCTILVVSRARASPPARPNITFFWGEVSQLLLTVRTTPPPPMCARAA